MSLVTLVLYAADKMMAVKGDARIPETVLLLTAAMGGGAGALIGTLVLRHKSNMSRKWYFGCVIFASLLIQIAMLLLCLGIVRF